MKKRLETEPIYFDTPEWVKDSYNCVYKITTADGHYKIGHTTYSVRDRVKLYFAPSNSENIAQIIHKDCRIKVEILDTADNHEILMVLEQLYIHKEALQILCNNGFGAHVHRFMGNDPFKFDCVKNSLFLNKRLDKLSHLQGYFRGEYDDFFSCYPFDETLTISEDSLAVAVTH